MRMMAILLTKRRATAGSGIKAWYALALTCAILFAWTVPAQSYWLPWTTERDKIDRRLNEIWEAFVAKDRKKLQFMVVGRGARNFIDQELTAINQLGIESVKCRITKLSIANYDWAFVEFERTDTLKSGGELKNRFMKAMRKINNDWKLITNVRKKDRPGKRFQRLGGNKVTASVKKRKEQAPGRMDPRLQFFQPEEGGDEQ